MQLAMKTMYRYYRILYSLFALLTLSLIITYHFTIQTVMLWEPVNIEIVIAVTGMIAGASVMIYFAKRFFFNLSGAGIFLKTKKGTLIKTSLYKYVRHPLYTATLLFVWSIFFWQPLLSHLISVSCITVYTIIGIHFEEQKLVRDFGESYIQYRSQTPMLIPKVLPTYRKNN